MRTTATSRILISLALLGLLSACGTRAPKPSNAATATSVGQSEALIWQARWRAALRAGVERVRWARTSAHEYYAARGQWPADHASAGLPEAKALANFWVARAELGGVGVFTVTLSAAAGGGTLIYRLQREQYLGWWLCSSPDRSDIALIFPECQFTGSELPSSVAAPEALNALPHANEIGAALEAALNPVILALETNHQRTGRWPAAEEHERIAVGTSQSYRGRWLERVELAGPEISVVLSVEAGGGTLKVRPEFATAQHLWWHCSSLDVAQIAVLLPGCVHSSETASTPSFAPLAAQDGKNIRDIHAWRAAVRADLKTTLTLRATLGEFYLTREAWPTPGQVLWPEAVNNAKWLATRFVASAEFRPERRLVIQLKSEAGGGELVMELVPALVPGLPGWWRCTSDRADVALILANCSYSGAGQAHAPETEIPDEHLALEKRSQLGEQITAAVQWMRANLEEFLAINPDRLQELSAVRSGLPSPEKFANPWLSSVALAEDLSILVVLKAEVGGGSFLFKPEVLNGQIQQWQCSSADRPDANQILTACGYEPPS